MAHLGKRGASLSIAKAVDDYVRPHLDEIAAREDPSISELDVHNIVAGVVEKCLATADSCGCGTGKVAKSASGLSMKELIHLTEEQIEAARAPVVKAAHVEIEKALALSKAAVAEANAMTKQALGEAERIGKAYEKLRLSPAVPVPLKSAHIVSYEDRPTTGPRTVIEAIEKALANTQDPAARVALTQQLELAKVG